MSADLHGASLDLKEAFHQNTMPEFGSLFGFDCPELASEWGVSQISNEDTGQFDFVDPSTPLYPVYEGLAMGFSWSVFLCQDLTSS